jgi:SAM-dependent methyltransferase
MVVQRITTSDNRPVAGTLDPEGAHLAALRRLADFDGRRVLEMGCGEGRLTRGITTEAASVVAFDPDPASVAEAQASLPPELPRFGSQPSQAGFTQVKSDFEDPLGVSCPGESISMAETPCFSLEDRKAAGCQRGEAAESAAP